MSLEDDLNQVNLIVENHHQTADAELTALLKGVQSRLLKSHKEHYTPIIKNLERKIDEQHVANDTMVKRSQEIDEEAEHLGYIFDKMVDHIIILKMKVNAANTKSKILNAWRDYATSRRIYENTMDRLYMENPMKRILFKRWLRRLHKVRFQRKKRELKRSNNKEIKQQENEATQKIVALQSELTAVKELLAEHERQHGDMEKKLKRAFMRGVVNLNLEAMDVFGDIPASDDFMASALKPPTKKPKKEQKVLSDDESEDGDDFYVEPAPRISVIRHK